MLLLYFIKFADGEVRLCHLGLAVSSHMAALFVLVVGLKNQALFLGLWRIVLVTEDEVTTLQLV